MEVITFVKGTVPPSKIEEFESGYENLKRIMKPKGLIASYLLQGANEEGIYIIENVWASQKALDKMRSEERPAGIELFMKFGVKPSLRVYNVVNSF